MSEPRQRYRVIAATAVGLVVTIVGMVSFIDSGYEITQMRNAFISSPGEESDFYWTPDRLPARFLRDSVPPPPEFKEAAEMTRSSEADNSRDLDRVLSLARHLSDGPGPGPGIRSDTRETYRTILTQRRGYCSDYTQVLNGLAYAAGIPIREWGMSFENYSGNGHGFSEIYDRDLKKWVFLDSFYSFYVVDAGTGGPLSVLELRERLAAGDGVDALEVREIRPGRFGFKSPKRALDYYRDGTDGFFLYFGNNVFSYDSHPVIEILGGISRALEETAGIVLGIRPRIRLVTTETNDAAIETLKLRRNVFVALAAAASALSLALILQVGALRRRNNDLRARPREESSDLGNRAEM